MRRLYTKFAPYLKVSLLAIFSTLILWLPFLLKQSNWFGLHILDSNFHYVYRHYDGPFYIVVAKTFYNPQLIERFGLESTLPPSYFAAHLPLFPILIALCAAVIGYLKGMIAVTLLSTILLASVFYLILTKFKITKNPLLLTCVFLLLPRFLVVRSIGAPESLFLLFIVSSLYFFENKKYFLAGLLGALSVTTKTPGILLFFAYLAVFIESFIRTKKVNWQGLWILLIPLGLISVFLLYLKQYGDFFAYFKSGDNIHLVRPFAVFNSQKTWVGTHWLEDVIFYFVMYGLTVVYLFKSNYRSFFYFAIIFFTATLFIEHRDIARYSLPLWPLAVIAFEKFFTSRNFLVVFILILIPAAYFYGWNFMIGNTMPITLWKPFL